LVRLLIIACTAALPRCNALGGPAATGWDLAQLLDVDVDQITGWSCSSRRITRPVGRSIHDSRIDPFRANTQCTIDAGIPTCPATRANPSFLFFRKLKIVFSTLRRDWCGQ